MFSNTFNPFSPKRFIGLFNKLSPFRNLIQIAIGTNWLMVSVQLMRSSDRSFTLWQSITAIHQCLRFLWLVACYPQTCLVPTQAIDAVIHILEQTALFNRHFDHQPGLGTRGEADRQTWLQAFQATRALFEHHFGSGSLGMDQPACCQIVDYRFARLSIGQVQPAACEICQWAVN